MAEKPPLRPEEVRRVLRELAPLSEDRRIILVGGQAVAFWAVFFELTTPAVEREIFTSKDIDFEGAARSARKAGELLDGDVRIPMLDDHTPNTGSSSLGTAEGAGAPYANAPAAGKGEHPSESKNFVPKFVPDSTELRQTPWTEVALTGRIWLARAVLARLIIRRSKVRVLPAPSRTMHSVTVAA